MALISGATNTYLETTGTLNEFFFKLNNLFIDRKWGILFYEGLEKLIVANPTGEFYLAFTGYEDFANNIYSVEIQCFRDYDENKGIHTQRLSIPKRGYKTVDENLYPPQFAVGDFSTNNNCYIQITDDYISGTLVDQSNKDCRAFFAGKFLTYSDSQQYNLPLFVGGSTQTEDDVVIDDTPCEPFDAQTNTTSNYMFGRRRVSTGSNHRVSDFVLTPSGEWQRLGILTSATIDTYPDINNDAFPLNFENSSVFPIASFLTRYAGNLNNGIETENVKIFTKQRQNETTLFLGEIPNIKTVYFDGAGSFSPVESIIQIDGEDYIVFRDVFRNLGLNNYYVMKVL